MAFFGYPISTTVPSNHYVGDIRFDLGTNQMLVSNGTDWLKVSPPSLEPEQLSFDFEKANLKNQIAELQSELATLGAANQHARKVEEENKLLKKLVQALLEQYVQVDIG